MHFLDHLEQAGFDGSPRRAGTGFDDKGNETLTFIQGASVHPGPWSDDAIVALGEMVARFHRASSSYQPAHNATWQDYHDDSFIDCGSGVSYGHGDLGPWNIMAINGLPVGFIDWDTAGPLDTVWELAHAAWLNVQLHDDDVAVLAGLGPAEHRAHQLGLFLDAYGLAQDSRIGFVDKMVEVAIRDAAHQAEQHRITAETTDAIAANGYPIGWAIAWRTRAAAWMLRNRDLLEAAI